MAKVINLRTRRKQLRRDDARKQAAGRAALSGIAKPDRTLARSRAQKAERDLDGHKRET